MEILRVVGSILVLCSATGIGYSRTKQYYKGLNQLRDLRRGMELIACQMNYTLYPMPKLLTIVGKQIPKPVGSYFIHLGKAIEEGVPRHKAHEKALQNTNGLSLPNDGLIALIEWSTALGQFDPDGENRMMKVSIERVELALRAYETEKKAMVRSYTLLGACAGIALVILIL